MCSSASLVKGNNIKWLLLVNPISLFQFLNPEAKKKIVIYSISPVGKIRW